MILDLLNMKKEMSWGDLSLLVNQLLKAIKNKDEVFIRCCNKEDADQWSSEIEKNYNVIPITIEFKNGYYMVIV